MGPHPIQAAELLDSLQRLAIITMATFDFYGNDQNCG